MVTQASRQCVTHKKSYSRGTPAGECVSRIKRVCVKFWPTVDVILRDILLGRSSYNTEIAFHISLKRKVLQNLFTITEASVCLFPCFSSFSEPRFPAALYPYPPQQKVNLLRAHWDGDQGGSCENHHRASVCCTEHELFVGIPRAYWLAASVPVSMLPFFLSMYVLAVH